MYGANFSFLCVNSSVQRQLRGRALERAGEAKGRAGDEAGGGAAREDVRTRRYGRGGASTHARPGAEKCSQSR